MPSERGTSLTRRQRECLLLVSAGLTSKEIARQLSISPSTVDNHLREAVARMGESGRMQAAKAFAASGQIQECDLPAGASRGLPSVSLIRVDDSGSFAVLISPR